MPLELVTYANPGLLADAATNDEWDVGLIGAEPARAAMIAFTRPYAELEASFLVREDCPARRCDDVDAAGYSIAVSRRAAYALKLEASLASATLRQTAEPGLASCPSLHPPRVVLARMRSGRVSLSSNQRQPSSGPASSF